LGGAEKNIIGVDEKEGRYLAAQLREEADTGDPVLRISATQRLKDGWSIFARKGFLAEWRRERQVASIDLRELPTLPGAHNHQNACAAYAVARIIGMGAKDIEAAFKTYPGGGVPKEGGITSLKPLLERIKHAYLIGESASDFANSLDDQPNTISETLENAVTQAVKNAKEGDVILLAPACASFDQFNSFEARGDAFVELIEAL